MRKTDAIGSVTAAATQKERALSATHLRGSTKGMIENPTKIGGQYFCNVFIQRSWPPIAHDRLTEEAPSTRFYKLIIGFTTMRKFACRPSVSERYTGSHVAGRITNTAGRSEKRQDKMRTRSTVDADDGSTRASPLVATQAGTRKRDDVTGSLGLRARQVMNTRAECRGFQLEPEGRRAHRYHRRAGRRPATR